MRKQCYNLGKDLEKLKKSMKLVIVPNGACEQHNDIFFDFL
jgi:creatinine amidohydrolase/Fe(II)-dependent formamide hydrolase-like protein